MIVTIPLLSPYIPSRRTQWQIDLSHPSELRLIKYKLVIILKASERNSGRLFTKQRNVSGLFLRKTGVPTIMNVMAKILNTSVVNWTAARLTQWQIDLSHPSELKLINDKLVIILKAPERNSGHLFTKQRNVSRLLLRKTDVPVIMNIIVKIPKTSVVNWTAVISPEQRPFTALIQQSRAAVP
jgi:hypothetical protein